MYFWREFVVWRTTHPKQFIGANKTVDDLEKDGDNESAEKSSVENDA